MAYDFKEACATLKRLDTERDALMITISETEDDAIYRSANKGIDRLHRTIKNLIVRYVQETHKVSRDDADRAMALLDEYDRECEVVDDWINDERPAVNV